MLEGKFVDILLGQAGGVFALGMSVGGSGTWIFIRKHILKVQEEGIKEVKKQLISERAACVERNKRLEDRIIALEQSRFELAKGD